MEERLGSQAMEWKGYYEEQIAALAISPLNSGNSNLREHIRFRFKKGKSILAHSDLLTFEITNISVGGISFYSDINVGTGKEFPLNIEKAFTINGRVLYCTMEEVDSGLMEYKYQVGISFLSLEDGYKTMSLLLTTIVDPMNELDICE